MAGVSKKLDEFLIEQSKSALSYVIANGQSAEEVDVYPYSAKENLRVDLRLSIPKSAVESVLSVGEIVELDGRTHEVVNIVFVGDAGAIYERVFEDLIDNSARKVNEEVVNDLKDSSSKFTYRPTRDWCGWHWPTR